MRSISFGEDNATLPFIVDHRAQTRPDLLYGATTWIREDGSLGLRKITYLDMSSAVNRCAKWIVEKIGKSTNFATLAYAGPSDYRYTIFAMAAAKTGHKALLLSSWNPTISQLKLLKECKCDTFLVAEDDVKSRTSGKAILAEREMQFHPFPTLDWVLNGPEAPFYPFKGTLDEVRYEDYMIIHTSGSTGHPKPMIYKYGAIAAQKWLAYPAEILPNAPVTNIQKVWSNRCHFMALPASHMGGMLGLGPFNIYWNMPMILAPPDRPIDADIVFKILSEDICDAAFIPPAYLQALSRNLQQIEVIRGLKHVLWVGAPFTSPEVANAIKSRVEIQPAYGSSEAGPFAFILESQDDYEWMHFHPIMGATFRHFSEDLYECVLVRDPALESAQFVFENFPHLNEWPTKDLFSRHPTRDDLWRFRGRKDDTLLLPNARNIDPGLIETTVAGHPKVEASLLYGSGRVATALLVEAQEPPTSPEAQAALVKEIWPTVEQGNSMSNVHACVEKNMILFTTKEKPFLRAGKGSVQRAMTLSAYQAELDQLYADAGKD